MTKFMNPSFSSPANNSNFRDNWDKAFGRICQWVNEDGKKLCENKKASGSSLCYRHLEAEGQLQENPETD